MAAPERVAKDILSRVLKGKSLQERAKDFRPRLPKEFPLPPRVPAAADHSVQGLEKRRAMLRERGIKIEQISGQGEEIPPPELKGSIENFIGFSRLPLGVIGPLRVNGVEASGDFFVPMSTTEGALLASYQRGANLVSLSGGALVMCTTESLSRTPCFVFRNMMESARFLGWAIPRFQTFHEIVAQTSRYARLTDVKVTLAGKEVYLGFEYTTGDASGQNMVTITTDAICRTLAEESPIKPHRWYIEGNLSGDKKATMLSFLYARGKKVVGEVTLPRRLVRRVLHVEPEDIALYWRTAILGGIQSGSIGVQGHFANGLAAIFIACGQDVACVAEASVGLNEMAVNEEGDLYACVVMPNLIVGTVGGGTYLPTARESLEMLDCFGSGKATKFAEICCAAVLAGEISITGSMAAGDFAAAHATFGRKPGRGPAHA